MLINSYIFDTVSPELYTEANALSIDNEADSTTGITFFSPDTNSSSTSPTPKDGSYLIKFTTTTPDPARIGPFTIVDTQVYNISCWAWTDTTSGGSIKLWDGFVTSPNQALTTTPTFYEFEVTASGTVAYFRWYADITGAEIYFDGLSIKKKL